jgi:hypothetical protein
MELGRLNGIAQGVRLRFTRFVELIEFFVLTRETRQTQETEQTLLVAMRFALCAMQFCGRTDGKEKV